MKMHDLHDYGMSEFLQNHKGYYRKDLNAQGDVDVLTLSPKKPGREDRDNIAIYVAYQNGNIVCTKSEFPSEKPEIIRLAMPSDRGLTLVRLDLTEPYLSARIPGKQPAQFLDMIRFSENQTLGDIDALYTPDSVMLRTRLVNGKTISITPKGVECLTSDGWRKIGYPEWELNGLQYEFGADKQNGRKVPFMRTRNRNDITTVRASGEDYALLAIHTIQGNKWHELNPSPLIEYSAPFAHPMGSYL
ncbi:MAG: hypothetical protein HY364_02880 [Candidatus Aenigmarchaeota archaeon]|nr:hypothetical protein [Candidatus Aenigmarchaeota archaeon]